MTTQELTADFFAFLNTNNVWLRGIVTAILALSAVFGTKLIRKLTQALHRRLLRFEPEWLRILNDGFDEPLILLARSFLIFLAVLACPSPFRPWQVLRVAGPVFGAVCIVLVAFGFWRSERLCGLLLRSAQNRLDLESNKTMIRFFEKIYRALVALFAALAVLELFGVPVTGLLTGAGIAGLAVSLAAQSTLSNLIAGITLVMERPFGIGDYVMLGSYEGTVVEISFRSTKLRTPDNVLISVENSKVSGEYILNTSERTSRLWNFTVGVTYDATEAQIEDLCASLTAMLKAEPGVVADSVQVILAEFGDSSINLDVRLYVETLDLGQFRALKSRINRKVMQRVEAAGCAFAFPSTSVYVESMPGK